MGFHIELEKVTKRFGEFAALRRLSATFHQGDRISILGHNGAGKSTLLNMIATLASPTEGEIHYFIDGEAVKQKLKIRALLTYLSHEPMLYPDLTTRENLRFVAGMYGVSLDDKALKELLERVGMSRAGDRLFRTCSRGMQQRLSIARALLPGPKLLLLDEPFSGLDSEGVRRLRGLFTDDHLSWLLVTHDLRMGYEMANRFWILRRGNLAHDLRKDEVSYEDYLELSQSATLEGVAR